MRNLIVFGLFFILSLKADFLLLKENKWDLTNFPLKGVRKVKMEGDLVYLLSRENLYLLDLKDNSFRKLLKRGGGPGEITAIEDFQLLEDKIVVFNRNPYKLVFCDKRGSFIDEKKVSTIKQIEFLFYFKGNSYFLAFEPLFARERKPHVVEIGAQIAHFKEQKNKFVYERSLFNYKKKYFIAPIGNSIAAMQLWGYIKCPLTQKKFLFLDSPQYQILLVDAKKLKIARLMKDFKRVKVNDKNKKYLYFDCLFFGGKCITPPYPKFYFDVISLLSKEKNFLVFTSRVKNQNQLEVHEYNSDGKFLRKIYVKFPPNFNPYSLRFVPHDLDGNYLITFQYDRDYTPLLIRYLIKSNQRYKPKMSSTRRH